MARPRLALPSSLLLSLLLAGCSSSNPSVKGAADGGSKTPEPDAKAPDAAHHEDARRDVAERPDAHRVAADAAPDAPARRDAQADASHDACTTPGCAASAIAHLVLIVQENHSFDNYFGRYCTAATGSDPTCNTGPDCCEAAPAMDPTGATAGVLDDTTNAAYNPDHLQACEVLEIDNGKMDKFVTGTTCSSPNNFAYADSASVSTYWQLAGTGALADRYFQPVAGASTSNDMYLARAHFVFLDDSYEALGADGAYCQGGPMMSYTDKTIGDLLVAAGASFKVYAGGYAAAVAANPSCAPIPPACPAQVKGYPCNYDPGDIPFEYYPSLQDNPAYMKDISQLSADLTGGGLPDFSFVKAIGYLTEHPGSGDTISSGEMFVQSVLDEIAASPYADSTLILLTWDESGGYFDHVAPPPNSTVDNEPYGVRIPFLALGPFARKNYVSHVTMEHSSVVTFLEWNWLGQQTGQLGTRDAVVHNIGSLLDPTKTGIPVPE